MAVAKGAILTDIASDMATILISGGYHTDVVTVSRQVKVWSEVGAQEMPWLGFAEIETTGEHHPFGLIRCTMKLKIVAHVSATTATACSLALANLEDDIIAAMNVDTTRATNATSTKWVRTATDVGDPAAMDSRGGYGSMEMDFEILFDRTSALTA